MHIRLFKVNNNNSHRNQGLAACVWSLQWLRLSVWLIFQRIAQPSSLMRLIQRLSSSLSSLISIRLSKAVCTHSRAGHRTALIATHMVRAYQSTHCLTARECITHFHCWDSHWSVQTLSHNGICNGADKPSKTCGPRSGERPKANACRHAAANSPPLARR